MKAQEKVPGGHHEFKRCGSIVFDIRTGQILTKRKLQILHAGFIHRRISFFIISYIHGRPSLMNFPGSIGGVIREAS